MGWGASDGPVGSDHQPPAGTFPCRGSQRTDWRADLGAGGGASEYRAPARVGHDRDVGLLLRLWLEGGHAEG